MNPEHTHNGPGPARDSRIISKYLENGYLRAGGAFIKTSRQSRIYGIRKLDDSVLGLTPRPLDNEARSNVVVSARLDVTDDRTASVHFDEPEQEDLSLDVFNSSSDVSDSAFGKHTLGQFPRRTKTVEMPDSLESLEGEEADNGNFYLFPSIPMYFRRSYVVFWKLLTVLIVLLLLFIISIVMASYFASISVTGVISTSEGKLETNTFEYSAGRLVLQPELLGGEWDSVALDTAVLVPHEAGVTLVGMPVDYTGPIVVISDAQDSSGAETQEVGSLADAVPAVLFEKVTEKDSNGATTSKFKFPSVLSNEVEIAVGSISELRRYDSDGVGVGKVTIKASPVNVFGHRIFLSHVIHNSITVDITSWEILEDSSSTTQTEFGRRGGYVVLSPKGIGSPAIFGFGNTIKGSGNTTGAEVNELLLRFPGTKSQSSFSIYQRRYNSEPPPLIGDSDMNTLFLEALWDVEERKTLKDASFFPVKSIFHLNDLKVKSKTLKLGKHTITEDSISSDLGLTSAYVIVSVADKGGGKGSVFIKGDTHSSTLSIGGAITIGQDGDLSCTSGKILLGADKLVFEQEEYIGGISVGDENKISSPGDLDIKLPLLFDGTIETNGEIKIVDDKGVGAFQLSGDTLTSSMLTVEFDLVSISTSSEVGVNVGRRLLVFDSSIGDKMDTVVIEGLENHKDLETCEPLPGAEGVPHVYIGFCNNVASISSSEGFVIENDSLSPKAGVVVNAISPLLDSSKVMIGEIVFEEEGISGIKNISNINVVLKEDLDFNGMVFHNSENKFVYEGVEGASLFRIKADTKRISANRFLTKGVSFGGVASLNTERYRGCLSFNSKSTLTVQDTTKSGGREAVLLLEGMERLSVGGIVIEGSKIMSDGDNKPISFDSPLAFTKKDEAAEGSKVSVGCLTIKDSFIGVQEPIGECAISFFASTVALHSNTARFDDLESVYQIGEEIYDGLFTPESSGLTLLAKDIDVGGFLKIKDGTLMPSDPPLGKELIIGKLTATSLTTEVFKAQELLLQKEITGAEQTGEEWGYFRDSFMQLSEDGSKDFQIFKVDGQASLDVEANLLVEVSGETEVGKMLFKGNTLSLLSSDPKLIKILGVGEKVGNQPQTLRTGSVLIESRSLLSGTLEGEPNIPILNINRLKPNIAAAGVKLDSGGGSGYVEISGSTILVEALDADNIIRTVALGSASLRKVIELNGDSVRRGASVSEMDKVSINFNTKARTNIVATKKSMPQMLKLVVVTDDGVEGDTLEIGGEQDAREPLDVVIENTTILNSPSPTEHLTSVKISKLLLEQPRGEPWATLQISSLELTGNVLSSNSNTIKFKKGPIQMDKLRVERETFTGEVLVGRTGIEISKDTQTKIRCYDENNDTIDCILGSTSSVNSSAMPVRFHNPTSIKTIYVSEQTDTMVSDGEAMVHVPESEKFRFDNNVWLHDVTFDYQRIHFLPDETSLWTKVKTELEGKNYEFSRVPELCLVFGGKDNKLTINSSPLSEYNSCYADEQGNHSDFGTKVADNSGDTLTLVSCTDHGWSYTPPYVVGYYKDLMESESVLNRGLLTVEDNVFILGESVSWEVPISTAGRANPNSDSLKYDSNYLLCYGAPEDADMCPDGSSSSSNKKILSFTSINEEIKKWTVKGETNHNATLKGIPKLSSNRLISFENTQTTIGSVVFQKTEAGVQIVTPFISAKEFNIVALSQAELNGVIIGMEEDHNTPTLSHVLFSHNIDLYIGTEEEKNHILLEAEMFEYKESVMKFEIPLSFGSGTTAVTQRSSHETIEICETISCDGESQSLRIETYEDIGTPGKVTASLGKTGDLKINNKSELDVTLVPQSLIIKEGDICSHDAKGEHCVYEGDAVAFTSRGVDKSIRLNGLERPIKISTVQPEDPNTVNIFSYDTTKDFLLSSFTEFVSPVILSGVLISNYIGVFDPNNDGTNIINLFKKESELVLDKFTVNALEIEGDKKKLTVSFKPKSVVGATSPFVTMIFADSCNINSKAALGGTFGFSKLVFETGSQKMVVSDRTITTDPNTPIVLEGADKICVDCEIEEEEEATTTTFNGGLRFNSLPPDNLELSLDISVILGTSANEEVGHLLLGEPTVEINSPDLLSAVVFGSISITSLDTSTTEPNDVILSLAALHAAFSPSESGSTYPTLEIKDDTGAPLDSQFVFISNSSDAVTLPLVKEVLTDKIVLNFNGTKAAASMKNPNETPLLVSFNGLSVEKEDDDKISVSISKLSESDEQSQVLQTTVVDFGNSPVEIISSSSFPNTQNVSKITYKGDKEKPIDGIEWIMSLSEALLDFGGFVQGGGGGTEANLKDTKSLPSLFVKGDTSLADLSVHNTKGVFSVVLDEGNNLFDILRNEDNSNPLGGIRVVAQDTGGDENSTQKTLAHIGLTTFGVGSISAEHHTSAEGAESVKLSLSNGNLIHLSNLIDAAESPLSFGNINIAKLSITGNLVLNNNKLVGSDVTPADNPQTAKLGTNSEDMTVTTLRIDVPSLLLGDSLLVKSGHLQMNPDRTVHSLDAVKLEGFAVMMNCLNVNDGDECPTAKRFASLFGIKPLTHYLGENRHPDSTDVVMLQVNNKLAIDYTGVSDGTKSLLEVRGFSKFGSFSAKDGGVRNVKSLSICNEQLILSNGGVVGVESCSKESIRLEKNSIKVVSESSPLPMFDLIVDTATATGVIIKSGTKQQVGLEIDTNGLKVENLDTATKRKYSLLGNVVTAEGTQELLSVRVFDIITFDRVNVVGGDGSGQPSTTTLTSSKLSIEAKNIEFQKRNVSISKRDGVAPTVIFVNETGSGVTIETSDIAKTTVSLSASAQVSLLSRSLSIGNLMVKEEFVGNKEEEEEEDHCTSFDNSDKFSLSGLMDISLGEDGYHIELGEHVLQTPPSGSTAQIVLDDFDLVVGSVGVRDALDAEELWINEVMNVGANCVFDEGVFGNNKTEFSLSGNVTVGSLMNSGGKGLFSVDDGVSGVVQMYKGPVRMSGNISPDTLAVGSALVFPSEGKEEVRVDVSHDSGEWSFKIKQGTLLDLYTDLCSEGTMTANNTDITATSLENPFELQMTGHIGQNVSFVANNDELNAAVGPNSEDTATMTIKSGGDVTNKVNTLDVRGMMYKPVLDTSQPIPYFVEADRRINASKSENTKGVYLMDEIHAESISLSELNVLSCTENSCSVKRALPLGPVVEFRQSGQKTFKTTAVIEQRNQSTFYLTKTPTYKAGMTSIVCGVGLPGNEEGSTPALGSVLPSSSIFEVSQSVAFATADVNDLDIGALRFGFDLSTMVKLNIVWGVTLGKAVFFSNRLQTPFNLKVMVKYQAAPNIKYGIGEFLITDENHSIQLVCENESCYERKGEESAFNIALDFDFGTNSCYVSAENFVNASWNPVVRLLLDKPKPRVFSPKKV